MDAMQRDVAVVRPDTSLRAAMRLMLENKYGGLPVVDASGGLVGIVTEADFTRLALRLVEDADRRELAEEYRA